MVHLRMLYLLSTVVALSFSGRAYSADWPMWRNDVARRGASSAALPTKLHLQWTRQLPSPIPAWPNESRLHFDASYEPVVLGSRMFVGSMIDGSVIWVERMYRFSHIWNAC